MSKNTFDLYRCHAVMWADLSYKDALIFRIGCAEDAMLYYKALADVIEDKFKSSKYAELVGKFKDSEAAVAWNKKFLKEVS